MEGREAVKDGEGDFDGDVFEVIPPSHRGNKSRVPDEKMDREEQVRRLNVALRLQHRSALQYTLTAGSLAGLEFQPLTGDLARFGAADL